MSPEISPEVSQDELKKVQMKSRAAQTAGVPQQHAINTLIHVGDTADAEIARQSFFYFVKFSISFLVMFFLEQVSSQ